MPTATVREPARELAVKGDYDVVVAGGGMAGVAAALAAARGGARVCLLERYCALGGLATLGNVTIWLPLCDGRGRQVIGGLGEELLLLSVADLGRDYPAARFRGVPDCWRQAASPSARTAQRYRVDFNPSAYLLALEKLVAAAGVKILYDTRFCGAISDNRRITHVVVESKSGRTAISGRVIVDASGDADVCHAVAEDTRSLDSNVLAGWFYTLGEGELRLHQLSRAYARDASRNGAQGPFFRGDDADQVTAHILATREALRQRLADLRAAPQAPDIQVLMPPAMACMRMTRRLVADFTLAEQHVHQWFDDAVGLTGDWRRAGPVYAIPFASLCAVRHDNLLVAGRCMSVADDAWDAMRAIPACVVTGEAAGTAAAMAVDRCAGDLRKLDMARLRTTLTARGVLLDRGLVAPACQE